MGDYKHSTTDRRRPGPKIASPRWLLSISVLMVGAASCDTIASQSSEEEWTTRRSFTEALRIVQAGVEALGGADAIARAGGLGLEGEGTLDLGTLLQGRRPFEGDAYEISERLVVIPEDGRLVHELRAPLNPDAEGWQRVDHRAAGTYRMNLAERRVSWGRPGNRKVIERTIPHLLLKEVLDIPETLRYLGTVALNGQPREAVNWMVPDRMPVTLLFDPATNLLREVETLADLPVRGDVRIRWTFRAYREVPGLGPFPSGYTISVDNELLQEVEWTRTSSPPTRAQLEAPEGIELPEPTPFEPADEPGSSPSDADAESEPEFDIRGLAPGVHLLVHLRVGFHMLFVEFEDYVVAVDAPAGWWELQELPPRNWAGGASPDLGERYVAAIRSRVPNKPIRYVILTHHHSDHMGGVRAFVDAGATVLGADITRPVVERTLAGSLDLAGRDDPQITDLRYESVEQVRTLQDDSMALQILDVGANPHADGMLAVWLPRQEILYVSDLFDPWGTQSSPSLQRLPVMRWFVNWLDQSALKPERIYAIHGAARVTEQHLAEIRNMSTEQLRIRRPTGPG